MKRMRVYTEFFKAFLKDGKGTASIVPTSAFAIRSLCAGMDFSKPREIIEIGPGTGNVAATIAKRMSPTSRLLLIEMNPELCTYLRERFAHDSRVYVHEGRGEDCAQIAETFEMRKVHYILANIPFSFFTQEQRTHFLKQTYATLQEGGEAIFFPFTKSLEKSVHEVFTNVRAWWYFANIPPLRIYFAKK